eukprot:5470641-Amphidinium_carterae.1
MVVPEGSPKGDARWPVPHIDRAVGPASPCVSPTERGALKESDRYRGWHWLLQRVSAVGGSQFIDQLIALYTTVCWNMHAMDLCGLQLPRANAVEDVEYNAVTKRTLGANGQGVSEKPNVAVPDVRGNCK